MKLFYNRQNLSVMIYLALMLGLLVFFLSITNWWLIFIPLSLMASGYLWDCVYRLYALSRKGYCSRIVNQGQLKYEERIDKSTRSFLLKLEYTEHGRYDLFLPSAAGWCDFVPSWAKDRRLEIIERIALSWKRENIHNFQE